MRDAQSSMDCAQGWMLTPVQIALNLSYSLFLDPSIPLSFSLRYVSAFTAEYEQRMAAKLGLRQYDKELTQNLLHLMAETKADFTNTLRALSDVPVSELKAGQHLMPASLQAVLAAARYTEAQSEEGTSSKDEDDKWMQWLQDYTAKVCLSASVPHK